MKRARPINDKAGAPGTGAHILAGIKQATPKAFAGTANPRHLRALTVLLRGPVPRERLDRAVGCSNGPQLVSDLKDLGLCIQCIRITAHDRDGRCVRPGVYHMTTRSKAEVWRWLAKVHDRKGQRQQPPPPELFGDEGTGV